VEYALSQEMVRKAKNRQRIFMDQPQTEWLRN
jgi:hypothetical protein